MKLPLSPLDTVTLTYNLLFEARDTQLTTLPTSSTHVAPDDKLLHSALSAALADPTLLPDGGYLGFGLNFKYPRSQDDSTDPISGDWAYDGIDRSLLDEYDGKVIHKFGKPAPEDCDSDTG
ncbi:hypothetical protein DXG03_008210 [Asterophora parasitica]|uniref:Uncharacterized protein n=1 Tax=Asterophora parasitica TaxID=117018 RepID=A0A9P7G865_9AGAR|nr:hypothetical protein DXG03_008210 [Asterophora parasitica]